MNDRIMSDRVVVHGICKLLASDCREADRADCYLEAGRYVGELMLEKQSEVDELVMEKQREVDRLRAAIRTYLEHPGCNAPARATAMAKLRWAAEQRP